MGNKEVKEYFDHGMTSKAVKTVGLGKDQIELGGGISKGHSN